MPRWSSSISACANAGSAEAAIADAWRTDAARLVLNTCTLDHAAALPNYLARGFRVTGTEEYEVADARAG